MPAPSPAAAPALARVRARAPQAPSVPAYGPEYSSDEDDTPLRQLRAREQQLVRSLQSFRAAAALGLSMPLVAHHLGSVTLKINVKKYKTKRKALLKLMHGNGRHDALSKLMSRQYAVDIDPFLAGMNGPSRVAFAMAASRKVPRLSAGSRLRRLPQRLIKYIAFMAFGSSERPVSSTAKADFESDNRIPRPLRQQLLRLHSRAMELASDPTYGSGPEESTESKRLRSLLEAAAPCDVMMAPTVPGGPLSRPDKKLLRRHAALVANSLLHLSNARSAVCSTPFVMPEMPRDADAADYVDRIMKYRADASRARTTFPGLPYVFASFTGFTDGDTVTLTARIKVHSGTFLLASDNTIKEEVRRLFSMMAFKHPPRQLNPDADRDMWDWLSCISGACDAASEAGFFFFSKSSPPVVCLFFLLLAQETFCRRCGA